MTMTDTKLAPPATFLLPEDAAADLKSAETAHADLLTRVGAGDTVDPAELLTAAAAVDIARARLPLAERNAQAVVTSERRAEVDRLLRRAQAQRPHFDRVLELHATAVAALSELYELGNAVEQEISSAHFELMETTRTSFDVNELGREIETFDIPDGVSLGAKRFIGGVQQHVPAIVVGDAAYPFATGSEMVASAVVAAVGPPPPHGQEPFGALRMLVSMPDVQLGRPLAVDAYRQGLAIPMPDTSAEVGS